VRRLLTVALAVVAVLATMTGCGSSSGSRSSTTTPTIEGTAWQLGLGTLTLPGLDAARPTMRLEAGKVSGSTGCNSYTGSYTLEGAALSFGGIASTAMACSPARDAIQTAFLGRVDKVAGWHMDGNNLVLTDANGSTVLSFVPFDTTLPGDWNIISFLAADAQSIQSAVTGSNPTVTFVSDGSLHGSTGCNTFSGTYTLFGTSISIGPLATTRAACTSDALTQQERGILAALETATMVVVEGNSAKLLDASDRQALTLQRA
jgi:heat shock protein HslJ